MRVGQDGTLESACTFTPACTSIASTPPDIGYPLSYAPPIVGQASQSFGAGLQAMTIKNTFRGFDNGLPGGETIGKEFLWLVACNRSIGTESTVINYTVSMSRSAIDAMDVRAALEPPAKIEVPCLVAGVQTQQEVKFHKPNSSLTYRELVSGWKKGQDIPWVYSRPSTVTKLTPTSSQKWDAASQPILHGIRAGAEHSSLTLNLKPPPSNQGADESWIVCIIPGDGYNWFPEICSEEFPVRRSQEECDAITATTTTPMISGASAVNQFGVWRLLLVMLVSSLFLCGLADH